MHLAEHFEVESAEAAVALAEELLARGRFDLFRGQTTDWPMRASFVRLTLEKQREAKERHAEFAAYVARTPELRHLRDDHGARMAIAQHHGMPTMLLDFTTRPAVAGWFATHGTPPKDGRKSVIYLAHEASVLRHYREALPLLHFLRIDVENLWRLQAQAGLFLHLPYADDPELDRWLAEGFGSIRFPFRAPLQTIPESAIYPDRKSRLEILLDGFATESRLRETHVRLRAQGVRIVAPPETAGPRPAPAFLNGRMPDVHGTWNEPAAVAWLKPPAEDFRRQDHPPRLVLEAGADALHRGAGRTLEAALASAALEFLRTHDGVRTGYLDIRLRLDGTDTFLDTSRHPDSRLGRTVAQDLADCWDGMRRFPYADETIAAALAYLATAWFLVHGARRSMYDALDELLGEHLLVEFGLEVGGQHALAPVPEPELIAAVRSDLPALLRPPGRALAARARPLLHQVNEPRRLFDLRRFAPLFGYRVVPGQFLLRQREVVLFTPAGIEKLGNR